VGTVTRRAAAAAGGLVWLGNPHHGRGVPRWWWGGDARGAPVRGRNRISETGDGGIFFTVSRQHCRTAADRWPLLQLPPPLRTILIIFQVIFRLDQ